MDSRHFLSRYGLEKLHAPPIRGTFGGIFSAVVTKQRQTELCVEFKMARLEEGHSGPGHVSTCEDVETLLTSREAVVKFRHELMRVVYFHSF